MNAKKQTVIINGKTYDMATGQAITTHHTPSHGAKKHIINDIAPNTDGILAAPKNVAAARVAGPTPRKARHVAPHSRTQTQKSTTLRRDILKKPTSKVRPNANKVHRHIQKSERITRFATPKPAVPHEKKHNIDKDLLAQTKALEKARQEHEAAQHKKATPISSRAVKEHLLQRAVDQVPVHAMNSHQTSHSGHVTRRARFTSVAMTSFALVLLSGYLTYTNIPNLSIRIAAANSGVDANLPSYQPAGYQIHGPISYSDGEVSVGYKQMSGNSSYKLTQKPTDWDPIATLDNYVQSDSKDDYQIHSVQGLTVYTYSKKAVWVNDGVLHVIDGTAPLSNQQVERIVASM